MRNIKIFSTAVMLVSIFQLSLATERAVDVKALVGATEAFLEELAAFEDLSLAVMVAHEGRPVLARAYGLANRSFDVPNRVDTRFNLASMNKMFTAAAIMQLVQQGKLRLNDKVGDHIPEYPNEAVRNNITVYQLLTHTAGMGNIFGPRYNRTPVNRFQSVDDYLPLFAEDDLRFAPGSKYEYSNAGYIVLGCLIEKITGRDYFSYVKENVFLPAGMTDTDYYDVQYPIPNLAIGYSRSASRSDHYEYKTTEYMKMTKGGPAGGGYSTVGDLIRFGEALFGNRLLDEEHTNLMTTGKVSVDDLPQGGRYGFGLVEQVIHGHRIVGHSGNLSGIRSSLKIYVDDGISLAVLSNVDRDQGAEELERFVQERITGATDYTKAYLMNSKMARIAVLEGYDAAVSRYNDVRNNFDLSEAFINARGLQALKRVNEAGAIALFRLNVFAFPDSSSAHASLAAGYARAGNIEKAASHYRLAIEIDPTSERAKEGLKEIETEDHSGREE
jgi:CubicO group peptidase (beta-lactamase class C family)